MREMRWASQDVKIVQFYARLAPSLGLHEVWLVAYMTLASATLRAFYCSFTRQLTNCL